MNAEYAGTFTFVFTFQKVRALQAVFRADFFKTQIHMINNKISIMLLLLIS